MNRKLSKSFVMSAAAIGMFTVMGIGSSSLALAETTAKQSTLVALGDSITFGYNLDDTKGNTVPSQSAFPYLMGNDNHLSVTDLGVPGWTSEDLLNQLTSPTFATPIAGASVITLDIGSNDLIHLATQMGLLDAAQKNPGTPITLTADQQQQFATTIAAFGKNLGLIVADIRKGSSAPIVLFNEYNPFPDNTALHDATEQFQTAQNALIVQLAASQKNIGVADVHKAFEGNQMTDVRVPQGDIHPTVQGQAVFAQTGNVVLKALLPTVTPPVTPTPSVPGGTSPATGLPFLPEGIAAIALLTLGGWLVAYSRRTSHSK
jgi:lysophospholipase L1-like esterase